MIREPGTGDVLFPQVRQRPLKFLAPPGIGARNPLPCQTGLPNTQKPDPVKTQFRQAIQSGIWNVIQVAARSNLRDRSVSRTRVLIW